MAISISVVTWHACVLTQIQADDLKLFFLSKREEARLKATADLPDHYLSNIRGLQL